MRPQDKEERRHAILEAAGRVLLASPDRIASVEEVAAAAGLAKGTVYLYFHSKESILLALHEDKVAGFFDGVIARAGDAAPVTLDDMNALVRRHMIDDGTFLPLASVCFAWQERGIPAADMIEFKLGTAALMARASQALAPHFPQLDAEKIHDLLLQSYGLIIGLWQLLRPMNRVPGSEDYPDIARLQPDYGAALDAALRALWLGRVALACGAQPADRARGPSA
jgi:AcrR family transcriptional regulator